MESREPFNLDNPFDTLANFAKTEVAIAGSRIMAASEMEEAVAAGIETNLALMIGVLTGACGIMMCQYEGSDDNHRLLRAAMVACLPEAFNQARSIMGIPPLPEAN